jgi:hypothetical protein
MVQKAFASLSVRGSKRAHPFYEGKMPECEMVKQATI